MRVGHGHTLQHRNQGHTECWLVPGPAECCYELRDSCVRAVRPVARGRATILSK